MRYTYEVYTRDFDLSLTALCLALPVGMPLRWVACGGVFIVPPNGSAKRAYWRKYSQQPPCNGASSSSPEIDFEGLDHPK